MFRFIPMAVLLLLAACLPFPHGGYYRPSPEATSAELLRRSCGGQVGPEEVLRLTVDGVEMRIRFNDLDGTLKGHIALTVAAGSRFRFLDGRFRITDPAGRQSVDAPHMGLSFYDSQARKSVSEPIDSALSGRVSRSIDLTVPSFTPSNFVLQLPPFEINGRTQTPAPIAVEYRAFDFGIYPFNC